MATNPAIRCGCFERLPSGVVGSLLPLAAAVTKVRFGPEAALDMKGGNRTFTTEASEAAGRPGSSGSLQI